MTDLLNLSGTLFQDIVKLVESQPAHLTYPRKLLRADLILCRQALKKIALKDHTRRDPFFRDFWLSMEWLTLQYQQHLPITEVLYEEYVDGQGTLEPVLDYLTRYHALAFHPELKINLSEWSGYYLNYIEKVRPHLWDVVMNHCGPCSSIGIVVPEGSPPF